MYYLHLGIIKKHMKAPFLKFSAKQHVGKKMTWSVIGERNDTVSTILRRINAFKENKKLTGAQWGLWI